METNNKFRQEQIDRYLLGRMDQTEKEAFEKQLKDDAELREDMELSRHIINAFHHEGEQEAFDALKSMSEEDIKRIISSTQETKKPRKHSLTAWVSMGAAALIGLLVYIGTIPQYSSEELFANYYTTQSYEAYPSRGDSELTIEERMQLQQAKKLYEQKEYQQALNIYERFFEKSPDWKSLPEEIIFHAAICQFETGNSLSAEEKLSYLAYSGESEFEEEALWNLSFVYLKENQRKKAKECLQKLIEKEGVYVDKAKEIIWKINSRMWF